MYKQTRGINDESYMNNQTVVQSRPMRYMTETIQTDSLLRHAHPESIDESSNLRMYPTRLNTIQRDNCELYGTAPFRMARLPSEIDIESSLQFSTQPRTMENGKLVTEKTFQFVDDIQIDTFINIVDNDIRSRSTRVDQRNQTSQNMNCRK